MLAGKVKVVLFDVDGTLYSLDAFLGPIFEEVYADFNAQYGTSLIPPSPIEIRSILGLPIPAIYERLLPGLRLEHRQILAERVGQRVDANVSRGSGQVYPGVTATIAALHKKGYQLFPVSNGHFSYVSRVLQNAKIDNLFVEITAVDRMKVENKTELVGYILETYGFKGHEAVVVGDREGDRVAAEVNGCHFIGCLYGHGNKQELRGANFFIEDIKELLEIL